MTYTPVKDRNTGNVWAWIKTNADGTTTNYDVLSDNWKKESEWTPAEVESLFTSPLSLLKPIFNDEK